MRTDQEDQTEQSREGTFVSGTVKWFDPGKGFGFVLSDDGGPDILLHDNVLRNFGQSSVADGARMDLMAQQSDRGIQATEVLALYPPDVDPGATLDDVRNADDTQFENALLEPARVKWFDKGKGFGFANVFGQPEDIFLHVEVLRKSGLSDLQPGEAIALHVIQGKRGKMAARVQAWETVQEE
ncbi:MAG: cold shock domain-containing protein [Sulfitobacter sp.]|nr:cold shock domain-containing protein [Sulfitobacter sp.]